MEYKEKILTMFGLILLLLVGKISIFDEANVEDGQKEETKIKPFTYENNICSLYDNSKALDIALFQRKYKPLVVIIADTISDGINRVININGSRRILNDYWIKHNPSYSQLHQTILENIYLFQANETYYFVYPLKFKYYFLTIYSQYKLLNENLGITFNFVNVKKEPPFFEDILIPLEPSCINCPLVKYVNEKLQKGESFSELFKLRKQLFEKQETKNLSFNAFNNYDICTSMGFNLNSKRTSSLLHFNAILNQIQNNTENLKKINKRKTIKRSLICFLSRNLEMTENMYLRYDDDVKNVMVMIDYFNWINNTVSSLKSNDISFGGICENEHIIETLKLFCFMKEISYVTSHNITAWIDALEELVAKPLISKLNWFNSLIYLYKNEYTLEKNKISSELNYLKQEIMSISENWKHVMNITYEKMQSSLNFNDYHNYDLKYFSICSIYKYWEIIDDLLLEVNFKRLVLIVADDMRTGIKTVNQITSSRVEPKVRREDLHYSAQFLYDVIMKHIYLVQSNDTYYYVYPTTADRNNNSLTVYFEYKIINDYSKVLFYIVNFRNYFSFSKLIDRNYNDLVIPALPDPCDIMSGNCETRYISPSVIIEAHKKFVKHFPQNILLYTSFYNKVLEFVYNYDSHDNIHSFIRYSQNFYIFLKEQKYLYNTNYLFKDLPCLSWRELNLRIDMDFSVTKLNDVFYFDGLVFSAYNNIILISIGNDTKLGSLCSNTKIFKFLKFFCFLKINYIDDMLKVINQKSHYISKIKSIFENEENVVVKYLLKTMSWIQNLLSMNYTDHQCNETGMFKISDSLYSQIPKITFNGVDLSNKIYLVFKNDTIFLNCQ